MKLKLCYLIALAFAVVLPELRGSSPVQDPASAPKAVEPAKKSKTPGKEMSQGGKDIGKGAAKGSDRRDCFPAGMMTCAVENTSSWSL